jgi:hypothetical protein
MFQAHSNHRKKTTVHHQLGITHQQKLVKMKPALIESKEEVEKAETSQQMTMLIQAETFTTASDKKRERMKICSNKSIDSPMKLQNLGSKE